MENFLEGGIVQLDSVKTAISDHARKEQDYKESERSLKAKQKELEIQRKRVDEKINAAVKKARTELEKGYDEELAAAERTIKDAENKKKIAKAEAVNLRMQRENSSLVDENKVLEAEMNARFKESGIPSFCKSQLYFSLFQPGKQKDYLICAAAVVILAGLIPFIVTRFVSTTFLKVLLWVLIVVFFAAIYFLILSWTRKGERYEVLRDMRSSRDRITDNKKFIKKRNKNIKADPDESQYNLSAYDQEVEEAKAEFEQAKARRDDAIAHFENVESISIRSDMEEEKAPLFQQMDKEIEQMQEDLLLRTEEYQEASRIMEEYAAVLGDKNMKADKLDELANIITEGKAATIQEALEVQKGK